MLSGAMGEEFGTEKVCWAQEQVRPRMDRLGVTGINDCVIKEA
jgi:hypothetical protein